MGQKPRRSTEPPPMELDDGGIRWRRDGTALVIERRVNLRALWFPSLVVAITAFIIVQSFRSGGWVIGGFMLFALIFPLAWLWMRIVFRSDIVVDADGIRWRQQRPRAFEGRWERDRVDGVRVHVHPRSRWLEPRKAHLELRVGGSWKTFLFSGNIGRAERLAEDLALVTGLVPDRVEADE